MRLRTTTAASSHGDPGLQPERTVMSWGRTVLALHVTALIFVRWYPEVGPAAFAPAVLAALAGAVIMAGQRSRYRRQSAGIVQERVRPAVASVAAVTGLVLALAALEGVAIVWGALGA